MFVCETHIPHSVAAKKKEKEKLLRFLSESAQRRSKLDKLELVDLVKYDADDETTVVGRGAFGKVVKGFLHGQAVAIKVLTHFDRQAMAKFEAEALLMSELKHTHIIQLLGVVLKSDHPGLVVEFASNGTLRSVLQNKEFQLSWHEPKLRWAQEIAKGGAYLHGHSYFDEFKLG